MLLEILPIEKKQYAILFRMLRKKHRLTQQEIADRCGISLRSYQSLEAGKLLKDDEHYEKILAIYHLHHDAHMDEYVEFHQLTKRLSNAFAYYHDKEVSILLAELSEALSKQSGAFSKIACEACVLMKEILEQERGFTNEEAEKWLELCGCLSGSIKDVMAFLLYQREYAYRHDRLFLAKLYERYICQSNAYRLLITAALHLANLSDNQIAAYRLLRICLKQSRKAENHTGEVDALAYLASVCGICAKNEFVYYASLCEKQFAAYEDLEEKRKLAAVHNLAQCYADMGMYEKAIKWFACYLNDDRSVQLPALLWYMDAQFAFNGMLSKEAIVIRDLSKASKALQKCWSYYDAYFKGKDVYFLERCLMKEVLPVLKGLHPAFHQVFHKQLVWLVKQTKHYKSLYEFECVLAYR